MNEKLTKAENLHRNGHLDSALALYESILEDNNKSVDALFGIATLHAQRGRYERAVEYFEASVTLAPNASDILYNFAVCLHKMSKPLEAFEKAKLINLKSRQVNSLIYTLAKTLVSVGQFDDALEALDLLSMPESTVLIFKARIYGKKGEWGTASFLLSVLAEQEPDNSNLQRELSLAAANFRDFKTAQQAFSRYLRLIVPRQADYLAWADLCLMARDTKGCRGALELYRSLGSETAESFALNARLLRLDGNNSEALAYASKALSLMPTHGQAWSIVVENVEPSAALEEEEKLRGILSQHEISFHNEVQMRYAYADLLHRLERYDASIEQLHHVNSLEKQAIEPNGEGYQYKVSESHFDKIKQNFPKLSLKTATNPKAPRYIFIVGMPRSGTTLVERILGQVPNVYNSGENEAMAFIEHQYARDLKRGNLPEPVNMRVEDWQAMAQRYRDRNPAKASVVTDKLPHNVQNVGLILSCLPDAKVVQLRRDPRDVCLSIYQRSFPVGHTYACDLNDLAHFYSLTDNLMDHWSSIAPDRVLDVKYENFVSNKEASIKSLLKFLDLPWTEACLDFYKTKKQSFTFSEMQVRKPINTDSIGRWKKYEPHLAELISALEKYGMLTTRQ